MRHRHAARHFGLSHTTTTLAIAMTHMARLQKACQMLVVAIDHLLYTFWQDSIQARSFAFGLSD